MGRFSSSEINSLTAYVPGEQPRDGQYIKLNTNESPYPPSPGTILALNSDESERLRLYSDPESKNLKELMSARYGVSEDFVFMSNGSDESLNFIFMAFFRNSKGVVFPDITYGFYKVFADLYGIEYDEIPLRDDFSINAEDYIGINRNIVIANPNAPSGIFLPLSDIERIVMSNPDSVVVIDEAYVDFGGESAVSLTEKYDNLIVVGTFSKSRSLAGARLGYAIGNNELIADLEKVKFSTNPYNINRLTQAAGAAALIDDKYYTENCKKIIETREKCSAQLLKRGFIVTPSRANFIFAAHKEIGGKELYLSLKEKYILVRHFETPRISMYNRITVGTPEDMQALIEAVDSII